jgi:hypothetical protein
MNRMGLGRILSTACVQALPVQHTRLASLPRLHAAVPRRMQRLTPRPSGTSNGRPCTRSAFRGATRLSASATIKRGALAWRAPKAFVC